MININMLYVSSKEIKDELEDNKDNDSDYNANNKNI